MDELVIQKKKCFRFELHKILSIIKGIKGSEPKKIQEEQNKNKNKKKKMEIDRMKEVTFRTEGEQHILVHKGIDLVSYFGDLPFSVARSGFDPPRLPLKRMEVKVKYATALQL